jgi:hypothetical protein
MADVEAVRGKADVGAHAWSTVHHVSLFGTICLSAAAAFLVKQPVLGFGEDAAAVFAATAALLTTMGGALGFFRKWKVNVTTRLGATNLLTSLRTDSTIDLAEGGRRLNAIRTNHAKGIIDESIEDR